MEQASGNCNCRKYRAELEPYAVYGSEEKSPVQEPNRARDMG